MMNTLDSFLQWLLSSSLRASALALAVLGLQVVLRRWLPARWRHALWLPVILVLVLPVLPASRFSAENRFAVPAEPQPVAVPLEFSETPAVAIFASPPWGWPPILFSGWLLGTCGVLVAGGVGYRRSMRRITRGIVKTRAEVTASVTCAARQLGLKSMHRVIVSTAVESPAVAGLLRPLLLLPAAFPNAAASPPLGLAFVGIFERCGMRSRIRAIACYRRTHPAWGWAAVVIIAALTLAGATRGQDAESDPRKPGVNLEVPTNDPRMQFTDQKEKAGWGKFVSFQDGTLKLKGNYAGLLWNDITEKSQLKVWDSDAAAYKASGTAEALSKAKPGTWVVVAGGKANIYVGARKGQTTGTFVSFKDERLLMLGKNLGPSYTKKYGDQLHMSKFADDVPVYESIDGGDYAFAGSPGDVLPKVKEGAVITIYGAGDDNITRIELGVKK